MKARIAAVLVFFVALVVYRSNTGYLYSYDSAPASLFVFNLVQHHRLDFDDFRDGYLYDLGASYVFEQTPDGHTEPMFPIGTALVTAPLMLAEYAVGTAHGPLGEITAQAFEPTRLRDEKTAAGVVASLAAALFFLCALRFARPALAVLGTIAFAFGSEMWSLGSQALWQHGTLALLLTALLLSLLSLRSEHRTVALVAAGILAGLLPGVRPVAIPFSIAALIYAFIECRTAFWPMVPAFALGAAPGLLWNVTVYHTLIGGYTVDRGSFTSDPYAMLHAAAGLLVSPSRGLLLFSPFVVLAPLGFRVVGRDAESKRRLLVLFALASLAIFANYTAFVLWDAGYTYGPRYMTDVMPVLALLFVSALETAVRLWPRGGRVVVAGAALLVAYSAAVQFVGVNGDPLTEWSGVPVGTEKDPARIWRWSDNQIERDALACYRLWTPNKTWRPAYAAGFDGRIVALARAGTGENLTALRGAAGESVPVDATVLNDGTSPWYGYASGMYYGQARVRVHFLAAGRLVREEYLYIADGPPAGGSAHAVGYLRLPKRAGTYQATFDIDVYQDPRIGARHISLRSVPLSVTDQ